MTEVVHQRCNITSYNLFHFKNKKGDNLMTGVGWLNLWCYKLMLCKPFSKKKKCIKKTMVSRTQLHDKEPQTQEIKDLVRILIK